MNETDRVFAGSIPELYDQLMVPMLFEPYAAQMAASLAPIAPAKVLEIAAGTGALTRALLDCLPATSQITATDLNPGMLHRAAARSDDARITYQPADALALPFADHSFDSVLCQFGVMFFPDKVKGYREARRVLNPGGTFLFNTWDSVETNHFVKVANATLIGRFPDDPPVFMARTPHGYHDLDLIRAQLAEAGFSAVDIVPHEHMARAASAAAAAAAYCEGTPLRNEIEVRGGTLAETTALVAAALSQEFGSGPIQGLVKAFVVTARP
jgi:ubiquinone/menaquinone biosynthesis C-methylase UbiE